jgi:hypothetical protein
LKKDQIDEFERLQGQLQSLYDEMNMLAKKSPNDALNKFKLRLVNSVLVKANTFLGNDKKPFGDFEQFDDTTLASTSDVLILVAQYLAAFEKLRAENIRTDGLGTWYWRGAEQIPTAPPKKLKQ